MRHLRALFLSTAVVTAAIVAGCGGDDSGSSSSGNVTPDNDGGDGTSSSGASSSGASSSGASSSGASSSGASSSGDGGPPPANSFPAYAKSLVETKTADNTVPDGESVWGALADDETPATSSALFPASFFQ